MNLQIYNGKEPEPIEPVRLRLTTTSGSGCIHLEVVDRNGERKTSGTLMNFYEDGSVELCCGVSSEFGFKLDELRHLNVTKEAY